MKREKFNENRRKLRVKINFYENVTEVETKNFEKDKNWKKRDIYNRNKAKKKNE